VSVILHRVLKDSFIFTLLFVFSCIACKYIPLRERKQNGFLQALTIF